MTHFLEKSSQALLFLLLLLAGCTDLQKKHPTIGGDMSSPAPEVPDKVCAYRHPLEFDGSVYRVEVVTFGKNYLQNRFRFLMDTGWPRTVVSDRVLNLAGCKGKELARGCSMGLSMGKEAFVMGSPERGEKNLLKELKVDGILGGDLLFSRELILDLPGESICFPVAPLARLARRYKWKMVGADFNSNLVFINFEVNGRMLQDYFLDTGSDTSSILRADARRLKLKLIPTNVATRSGKKKKYEIKRYGPAKISWGGHSKTVPVLIEAPGAEYRKIGNDFLQDLAIGLSPAKFKAYLIR